MYSPKEWAKCTHQKNEETYSPAYCWWVRLPPSLPLILLTSSRSIFSYQRTVYCYFHCFLFVSLFLLFFVFFDRCLFILIVICLFWPLSIYFDRCLQRPERPNTRTAACSNKKPRNRLSTKTRTQKGSHLRMKWNTKTPPPRKSLLHLKDITKTQSKRLMSKMLQAEVRKYRFGSKCGSVWHEVRNYGFRVVVTKEIRDTHYAGNIMFSGLKLILYAVS